MITNTGKFILGKYLIGQAPAYASYIAIGCGPHAADSDDLLQDYSEKTNLEFEMFRVPITSRGFISDYVLDTDGSLITDEGGTPIKLPQIVFTAEMPTEERYEITEIGLYSSGFNPIAGAQDSKPLYSFTEDEGWYSDFGVIQKTTEPLDDSDNVIREELGPFIQTNANNRLFTDQQRVFLGERCRYLNNVVMVRGDMSNVSYDEVTGFNVIDSEERTPRPIIINNVDLASVDKNAVSDEIRLAFTIVNVDGTDYSVYPENVNITLEFSNSDGSETAKMHIHMNKNEYNFESNRYFVVSKKLSELERTSAFSWSQVAVVKIYSTTTKYDSVTDSEFITGEFFVAFDAIRLENITDTSPLYGMTGYTVVRTDGGTPIVKAQNTSGFVEFRLAVDVG